MSDINMLDIHMCCNDIEHDVYSLEQYDESVETLHKIHQIVVDEGVDNVMLKYIKNQLPKNVVIPELKDNNKTVVEATLLISIENVISDMVKYVTDKIKAIYDKLQQIYNFFKVIL